jgi:hypothetical protein
LAVLLYPSHVNGTRGWLFSGYRRLDYGRLGVEVAAALVAAVLLALVATMVRWQRPRLSRQAAIGVVLMAVALIVERNGFCARQLLALRRA